MGFRGAFAGVIRAAFEYVASGVTYLLRDEFTTDDDAPLTSTRTCEPGPGTLAAINTGRLSISGSKIVYTAAAGSCRLADSAGLERSTGRAFILAHKATNSSGWLNIGFDNNTSGSFSSGVALRTSGSLALATYPGDVSTNVSLVLNTAHTIRCVIRGAGAYLIVDNELAWVDEKAVSATVYAGWYDESGSGTGEIDSFRVVDLGSPYDVDYGIATNRIESASAGATTTMEASAIVEATWTAVTGETYELDVRRTDDDNRWIARCSQSGSTIKLIERNGGTETERSSAAQTWTNGTAYRLVVITDGNVIKTSVATTAKNSYASATFNNTATGVKTSHAVSNLIAWPRILSGAALAALEAV